MSKNINQIDNEYLEDTPADGSETNEVNRIKFTIAEEALLKSFEDLFLEDAESDIWDDSTEAKEEIAESENLFKEAKDAYNKIDDKLLEFIGNFVENQNNVAKQKVKLKNIFFWFAMLSFALIVLTPIICLVVLVMYRVTDYYIVFGSIAASLIEVLTTVIVLPKIVAEYLFNKKEEKENIKIVELMQKYSDTMHGYDNKK